MELHQLRYLVAVLDDGSFTAAAARLHVSQSGISAQVAKLERELGHALLVRGPRRVHLTAAGDELVPLARELLRLVETIQRRADELNDLVRGRVRIGLVVGCSIPAVLEALAGFHRDHPLVELTLREDDSSALVEQVLAGHLDLALVSLAGDAPYDDLEVTPTPQEPLVAVAPHGHRLIGAGLRLGDLLEESVLSLPHGTGTRAALEASCVRRGVQLRVALEATSPAVLFGLVERGLGVGVVTASMAPAGLASARIVDAEVGAGLALVRRPEPAPAPRRLHAALVEALRGLGPA